MFTQVEKRGRFGFVPCKLTVECLGAIHHLMSRENGKQDEDEARAAEKGRSFTCWLSASCLPPGPASRTGAPQIRLGFRLQPLRDAPQSHLAFRQQTQGDSYGSAGGLAC
jgi:hypothetical protein